MKKSVIVGGVAAVFLLLCGCSQEGAQRMDYIGLDAAKTQAASEAGLSQPVEFTTAALSSRDGIEYYALAFTYGGENYEYDVDALTGVIIESRTPNASDASLVSDADTFHAENNTVQPPLQTKSVPASSHTAISIISLDEAKVAALKHAGLTAEQVTFAEEKLGWEKDRQVYEIEFYTADYMEYDYEIDAGTGEIVSFDYEAEAYTPPTTNLGMISEREAKEIALAQVPGAAAGDIRKFKLDRDDGKVQYEGRIVYNEMEYDFEIDAYSGAIRDWEAESIYD